MGKLASNILKGIILVALIAVIAIGGYLWIKERNAFRKSEKELLEQVSFLQAQRDQLRREAESHIETIAELAEENSALKLKSKALTRQIAEQKVKYDSLLAKIPEMPFDTIYILMQGIYPTQDPLAYPLAGEQLRYFYSSHQQGIKNASLLKTHENALNSYIQLTGNLEAEISEWEKYSAGLKGNLALCNEQVELLSVRPKTQKQNKWITIGVGLAGFLAGLAIK